LNIVRQIVRRLIVEAAGLGVNERLTVEIAKFVSGETLHSKLDVSDPGLQPFVKRYDKLYRVWQNHSADAPEDLLEREARSRSVMSCTRDPATIASMLDTFGLDDEHPVTVFDAVGFDPYEVMRAGLKANPGMRDAGYVRAVLSGYSYQQEIVALRVVGPVRKVN